MHIHLCIVHHYFHTMLADLSSLSSDFMTNKTENVYFLA